MDGGSLLHSFPGRFVFIVGPRNAQMTILHNESRTRPTNPPRSLPFSRGRRSVHHPIKSVIRSEQPFIILSPLPRLIHLPPPPPRSFQSSCLLPPHLLFKGPQVCGNHQSSLVFSSSHKCVPSCPKSRKTTQYIIYFPAPKLTSSFASLCNKFARKKNIMPAYLIYLISVCLSIYQFICTHVSTCLYQFSYKGVINGQMLTDEKLGNARVCFTGCASFVIVTYESFICHIVPLYSVILPPCFAR